MAPWQLPCFPKPPIALSNKVWINLGYSISTTGEEAASEVSIVELLSHVWLFVTPWTATCQASLSFTTSQNLLKLMSIESVMPSNYLILCHPLLLLPSIFPSIRVFSNELVLHIRWPKYWNFSFSISLSNKSSGFISFQTDWFGLLFLYSFRFFMLLLSYFSVTPNPL